MVSTHKKRLSSRRLPSQLDDFDGDFFGYAASDRQEIVVVKDSTVDQENTVKNTDSNLAMGI